MKIIKRFLIVLSLSFLVLLSSCTKKTPKSEEIDERYWNDCFDLGDNFTIKLVKNRDGENDGDKLFYSYTLTVKRDGDKFYLKGILKTDKKSSMTLYGNIKRLSNGKRVIEIVGRNSDGKIRETWHQDSSITFNFYSIVSSLCNKYNKYSFYSKSINGNITVSLGNVGGLVKPQYEFIYDDENEIYTIRGDAYEREKANNSGYDDWYMIDKLAIKNGKIYYRYVETYSELPTGFVTNINQIDVSKIGKTKVTIPSAIK